MSRIYRNILGLVNYYCQFIEEFVSIARPLYDIIKKDKKWDWTEKQEKVFRELKKQFIKKPVLAVLNLDKKLRVEVDVSDYTTEGVLSMEGKDGK